MSGRAGKRAAAAAAGMAAGGARRAGGGGLRAAAAGLGRLGQLLPRRRPWLAASLAGVVVAAAVAALGLAAAGHRAASHWSGELAGTATLSVIAEEAEIEAQARAALEILRETPGVLGVRVLDPAEQRALLAPWLGTGIAFDGVALPLTIDVATDSALLDRAALDARLAAEAPGAVFDDHGAWRLPYLAGAERLRRTATLVALALGLAAAGAGALAGRGAVAAARPEIELLSGIGMEDGAIGRAVLARLAPWLAAGCALGALAGILVAGAAPPGSGPLLAPGFQGWSWVLPPLAALAGAASCIAASWAAARTAIGGTA